MTQEMLERLITLCYSGIGTLVIRYLFLGKVRYQIRKGLRWGITIGLIFLAWLLFQRFW